jgi:NTE family protein
MKIGLAFSGGGVRATAFHLGVLRRLAESNRWLDISFISTVSGGSLCIALVFEVAGQKWPAAESYLHDCLPTIRTLLTTTDIEGEYKIECLARPWTFFTGRASIISSLLQKHWGIKGNVSQMPEAPRWTICATCYETGKCWRFSRARMGDYLTNYVINPSFPLADAVAASAAVPGIIGPLRVATEKYDWFGYPEGGDAPGVPTEPIAEHLSLWDGGIYDNLAVEAIFKPKGFRPDVDFLIASDASRPLGIETRRLRWGMPWFLPPFRLIDIATDQVRAIRVRNIVRHLEANAKSGVLLRMGNEAVRIFKGAKVAVPGKWIDRTFQSASDVAAVAGLETTLRRLSEAEFDRIAQHGYEVADVTLFAYGHNAFDT